MPSILARSAAARFVLAAVLACSPADVAAQTSAPAYDDAIARGRVVLQRLVDEGRTPGVAVAVVHAGRTVWTEGFGVADLEHGTPVTPRTRLGLGSISKTLTMAGVLSLVDAGALDLDAPVERYLPDFAHAGRGITLRRIAAHQSGLSDAFANEHYQTTRHFENAAAAYAEIARAPLQSEPGSRVEYATGLYTIIARVMEIAAGRDYLTVMQERVFGPLGLTSIVPNDRAAIVADRTGFYIRRDDGAFEHAPFFDPSFKLAGAGFIATAEDVAKFGAALLRPGLLSERSRRELFTPVPLRDDAATEFALGLRRGTYAGAPLLHQPGGGLGISSWLFIHPQDDLVIALLGNVPTAPVGGATHRAIADAFLDAIRRR